MSRSISADPDLSASDGQLRVVASVEAVRQRAVQRVRLMRGEAILDGTAGVPYLQEVFRHPSHLAAGIIVSEIRRVQDVTDVSGVSADFDSRTRRLSISATLHTADGTVPVSAEV